MIIAGNKKTASACVAVIMAVLSISMMLTSCKSSDTELNEVISHDGYQLEQVIVLSRHNIRAPLSAPGSVLATITPHEWFEWTSGPSELSLRGGVLETEMGQYFRKWLEAEELIPENYHPAADEVRIYANSKQRTIATAQYFSAGMFPTANLDVEYHVDFDTMDPVFTPQLTFSNAEYAADAEKQIRELFSDDIAGLSDNYKLLSKVIDFEKSESYKNGEITSFKVDDSVFKLEEGAEPAVSGSLKTACSVSDALVLQYYEEKDSKKAGFGRSLTVDQWEDISEIKDVYVDVLFTAPLVATNVANPLLEEMLSEMNANGRKFTFLCGHDSNIGSVLAALETEEYELPNTVEKKTPIGSKFVLSKWSDENGEIFWSADLVYQTTEQLRGIEMLNVDNPPASYPLMFKNIQKNSDGLYKDDDIRSLFENSINDYYDLYDEYFAKAA